MWIRIIQKTACICWGAILSFWLELAWPSYHFFCSLQLTRAYFAFLEVLFNSHIVFVLNLHTSAFMHIVSSLESGLKGLDVGISSQVLYDESILPTHNQLPLHLVFVFCQVPSSISTMGVIHKFHDFKCLKTCNHNLTIVIHV